MTWLLSVDALNPAGGAITLRFSTSEYFDANAHAWLPRIQQPGLYTSGMFAGDLLRVDRSGYGETTLVNVDGALDYLVDYALDGRRVVLQLATTDQVIDVLVGTVARVTFEERVVSLRLRDPIEVLRQPHPLARYAGNNVLPDGLEGLEDDIGGAVKPRLFGQARNAEPVIVNSSRLIYQVSDAAATMTAVYDDGVLLKYDGEYASLTELQGTPPTAGQWADWEPPAGTYRRCQGYIRLGSQPTGTITCDANAPATRVGDVLKRILDDVNVTCDANDVANLNAMGDLRLWVNQSTTTADLLDRIAVSIGGYWRLNEFGVVRMGALLEPGNPVATLHDHQIIEINRDSAGAGDNGLPVWSVTLSADPIETTQTTLARSVSAQRRARLSREYREVTRESRPTLERHPLASAISIESRLATTGQAAAVTDRLLALLSPRRDTVTLTARTVHAARFAIGTSLRVITPRLGYTTGRTLLVIGRAPDAALNRIQLTLWG